MRQTESPLRANPRRCGLLNGRGLRSLRQFDGNKTLKIRTEAYEFETQSLKEGDKWLFNGAVAGDIDSIKVILKKICDPLRLKGYEANFEIYDENFEFISEYP